MTVLIAEILKQYTYGMLLVTDEVRRMNEYVNTDSKPESLGEIIQKNCDRILIYTAENAREDRDKLFSTPVIIMTTQRFFELTRKEVIALTSTYIPKRYVVIDERAWLTETVRIDYASFNTVDSTLNTRIDDTRRYKPLMTAFWQKLSTRYQERMKTLEKGNEQYELKILFHDDEVTEDDRLENQEFLEHCLAYKKVFRHCRLDKDKSTQIVDILKIIRAIIQIADGGNALFVSKLKRKADSKNEYSNAFYVTLDHRDLLLNTGSKTIILDGTGLLDPIYQVDYVNCVDCSQFARDLSNLTIDIFDVNTSKRAIVSSPQSKEKLTAIADFIRTTQSTGLVITYGEGSTDEINTYDTVERFFHDEGFSTAHLWGLKGRNDFNQETNLVQVGLARKPDEYYESMAIHNELQYIPAEDIEINSGDFREKVNDVMIKSLLCDVEQNLYRGIIRMPDNNRQQTYTLMFRAKPSYDENGNNTNELSALTDEIKQRYESMGATVNVHDAPEAIRACKTRLRRGKDGKLTNAQILTNYLNDMETMHPGETIKRAQILDACNMSVSNYKKVLHSHTYIKQRLDRMRSSVIGYYTIPSAD